MVRCYYIENLLVAVSLCYSSNVSQVSGYVPSQQKDLRVVVEKIKRIDDTLSVQMEFFLNDPSWMMFSVDDSCKFYMKSQNDRLLKWQSYGSFAMIFGSGNASSGGALFQIEGAFPEGEAELEGQVAVLAAKSCEPMSTVPAKLQEKSEFDVQGMPVLIRSLKKEPGVYVLELKFRDLFGIAKFEFITEGGRVLHTETEGCSSIGLGSTQYISYRIFTEGETLSTIKVTPYRWSNPQVMKAQVTIKLPKK